MAAFEYVLVAVRCRDMRGLCLLLLFFACTPESRLDPVTTVLPRPAAGIADEARSSPTVCTVPAVFSTSAVFATALASTTAVDSDPTPGVSVAPGPTPGMAESAVRRPEVSPLGLITAAHDEAIATFAATDDGGVAVSLDRRGGMRLWPSLDGTREPVIVRGEAVAEQVAIARDGGELVIAAAGPLGQIELIRTSALGEPVSHRWIDLERKVVALYATPSRFVGLLDDQTIAAIDFRGEGRGEQSGEGHGEQSGKQHGEQHGEQRGEQIERLTMRPGERIVAMASRRGAVLAFVNAEGSIRARWIEVTETRDTLAWGGESPALRIDPEHAVLAPDRRRVAALTRDHKGIVIVDLASGRTLERPVDMDFADPMRQPLGFIADGSLQVLSADGTSAWWRHQDLETSDSFFSLGTVVATDRCILTASGSSLLLATPETRRQLGFRVVNIASAQPHRNGWTVTDGSGALGLDDRFHARRRFLPRDGALDPGRSLVVLDGRHGVLATTEGTSLIDLEHPADGKLLSSMIGTISYEPTTHLVAISGDAGLWLGHYSSRTHDIDHTLDILGEPRSIVLLDPELNDGNVALVLVQHEVNVTITEVRKVDFAGGKLREGRSYERLLPDGRGGPPDPVIWLGLTNTARHHTSPDGSLVALVGKDRITLRDRDGGVRWSIARSGVTDVAWSSLGELIAFGSGMARVDVGTGVLLDRQCGWDFGLWDDVSFEIGARLCEVP